MIFKSEILLQNGSIKNIKPSHSEGKVVFSNLFQFQSNMFSDYYSIKFVFNGCEHYLIEEKKMNVNNGQLLIVKPNQEVYVDIDDLLPTDGICLYVSKKLFEDKIIKNSSKKLLLPNFPIDVSDLKINQFYNTLRNSNSYSTDLVLLNFLSYLKVFIFENNTNLYCINANKEITKLSLWEKMEIARSFIKDNLHTKILLPDIADKACLSTFHFQRTFKAFYKTSPSSYIRDMRMKKARKLLNSHNLDIYEVALECGFEDVKYFRKCLKNFLK